MATTAREQQAGASSSGGVAAAAAASGAASCAPAVTHAEEGRHARTLTWSSIAKSLLAGGVAGGV
jgi:hypothetical protein